MRAASKNAYVRFQVRSSTRDSETNEPIGSWSTHRTVWVHLYPKRNREKEAGGQVDTSVQYVARGDFYDLEGVTPEMRVVYSPSGVYTASTDWVYFDIEGVLVDHIDRSETTVELRQTTATTVGYV
jgi:head-tail adaptor